MENLIDIWMGGADDGCTPAVQQYDVKSRVYVCRLWRKKNVPYEMSRDAVAGAVFEWRGSPPSKEYNAEIVDQNTIRVTVPTEAMLKIGPVDMQLIIHQNGGELRGPVVQFTVLKSLKRGDQNTDEPVLLLVALVNQTQEAIEDAEEAAKKANSAGERAEAAAKKLNEIDVDVEMLAPSAEASARVEQTEAKTVISLGIPSVKQAYATFEVDNDLYLQMNTPEGYGDVTFELNEGYLEVKI